MSGYKHLKQILIYTRKEQKCASLEKLLFWGEDCSAPIHVSQTLSIASIE